jgi:shikimate kinase
MSNEYEQSIILVYGPSGVGKTTAFHFAMTQVPNAKFASLDKVVTDFAGKNAGDLLVELGPDEFLETGKRAIKELLVASPMQPVVLDVGAGFLESRHAGEWLSTCKCVVFRVSPEVAHQRDEGRRKAPFRTLVHPG